MVEAGGFGRAVPSGTNPTVISWRLSELEVGGLPRRGAPGLVLPRLFLAVVVEITHERACTTPTLPASGVPAAHFSPLVYVVALVDGYFNLVLVNVNPVYPSANFPRVALLPASLEVFGATTRTPLPVVVRPVVALEGDAGERRLHGPADVEGQAGVPRRPHGGLDDRRHLVVVVLGQCDRCHPDDDDDDERGVPVHRHLPAIRGAAARCGGACN